jgi:hypothetical protein
MKWIVAIAAIALFAAAKAEEMEDGEARVGYVTLGSNGDASITFNATSIQNAVILGLFVLVLGALILPLLGINVFDDSTGYGYGYEHTGYDTSSGYSQPSGYGHSFAKRSLAMMAPVLDMLSQAYKKYDD